eukprot:499011-Heterocapsa_arctica.AAC.1
MVSRGASQRPVQQEPGRSALTGGRRPGRSFGFLSFFGFLLVYAVFRFSSWRSVIRFPYQSSSSS